MQIEFGKIIIEKEKETKVYVSNFVIKEIK